MGWNKTGSTVKGLYLFEYPVTGTVVETYVRYGGTVSYHVQLDEPLFLFGSTRDLVILDEKQITHDFGVIENAALS